MGCDVSFHMCIFLLVDLANKEISNAQRQREKEIKEGKRAPTKPHAERPRLTGTTKVRWSGWAGLAWCGLDHAMPWMEWIMIRGSHVCSNV